MTVRTRRRRPAKTRVAIEDTQALLAAIVNSSEDAIYSGDMDGIILSWNAGAERLFGYSAANMVGRSVSRLYPEGREAELRRIMASVRSGDPASHFETTRQRKDGTLFPVAMTVSPIWDAKGTIMGASVIARDIAERLRTEAERRRAEEQYRELVEGVRDVIFSLTPDGVLTSLNPAFEQITGMPPGEWIGRPFVELLHPDDVERADRELGAAARGEHRANPPLRIRTRDGSYRFGEVHLTPRMHDGRITGLLGIGRDVSERVELESQFRQAQKMEAVGRLAGGVAHDFNNLLTVIIGSGQMVLGGMARDDQDRGDIELMVTAGERAAELTRQLLAFSRRQALQPRTLDLNAALANIEKLLGRLVGDDVRLLTVPAAHLGFVRADPGQIEQVVANLVVNARDAMPTGGTLTIATKNVDLDEAFARSHPGAGTGPHVMLSVTDTGAGMSEDIKSRIFEPFFTTKESGKGTGLGLSTVYGIVQQSGGQIQVLSELGRGTCFEVYLPRVGATADGAEDVTALGTLHGSETVLVAEDDTIVRNLEVKVLRGYGYTILAAPNGASALRIAAQHPGPVDLLVTDLVMPEMGGRELSEHLAAIRPGLKTLYVSGYADDSADRSVPIGPDVDFIQKPFTPVSLGQKVREMLGPRR